MKHETPPLLHDAADLLTTLTELAAALARSPAGAALADHAGDAVDAAAALRDRILAARPDALLATLTELANCAVCLPDHCHPNAADVRELAERALAQAGDLSPSLPADLVDLAAAHAEMLRALAAAVPAAVPCHADALAIRDALSLATGRSNATRLADAALAAAAKLRALAAIDVTALTARGAADGFADLLADVASDLERAVEGGAA